MKNYPKWVYKDDKGALVQNQKEWDALGEGWAEEPTNFETSVATIDDLGYANETQVSGTRNGLVSPDVAVAVEDPMKKTSGDGTDAGDWTKTGDGTDYPDALMAEAKAMDIKPMVQYKTVKAAK